MRKSCAFLFLVLSFILWNCGKDDKEINVPDEPDLPEYPVDSTETVLNIPFEDIILDVTGEACSYTFYCNTDWTITNTSEWCKVNAVKEMDGTCTITVSATPHEGYEDRNALITIKAKAVIKTFTVTQKQKDAIILTKDRADVSQDGGVFEIEVKSNIEFYCSIPREFGSWITQQVDPESRALESHILRFSVTPSNDDDLRMGIIRIDGGNFIDTIHVYQAPKSKLFFPESDIIRELSSKSCDFKISLRTNIDYDVIIPEEVASWISLPVTRALRYDVLTFSIADNTTGNVRTAKIFVKDKNSSLSDTLVIKQWDETTWFGDKVLKSYADLTEFKKGKYKKISGNLRAETGIGIELLIEEIGGSLFINRTQNGNQGLPWLVQIGGNLKISGNNREESGVLLPRLKKIGGDLDSDVSYKEFKELTEIGGNLPYSDGSYKGLEKLESVGSILDGGSSLEGLENLRVINGDFRSGSSSFKGLENLRVINGNFNITGNQYSLLSSFEELSQLTEINGDFRIHHNFSLGHEADGFPQLTSLKGLEGLKRIGGSFFISGTSVLTSLEGLCNITTVGGINISNLPLLTSLEGLSNITTVGGGVSVYRLPLLTSLKGLNNLTTVGLNNVIPIGGIHIGDLPLLTSLEGLSNLTTVGGSVWISALPLLTSLEGLNLTTAYNVRIDDLPLLTSLEGLNNLTIIEHNLELNKLNSLVTLHGLENLRESTGISISDCEKLNDINAISNIKMIKNKKEYISISDCPILYDFCPLKSPIQSVIERISISIQDNGYNPTREQILNGECSKTPKQ